MLHMFQGKYDIDDWNNLFIEQTWNLSHGMYLCFVFCGGACGRAAKTYAGKTFAAEASNIWENSKQKNLIEFMRYHENHDIICDFSGESALHFAVVHEDLESVKLLVEKGANVNQRATGRFFLPEDQKKEPKAKHTDYNGKKLLFFQFQ